MFNTVTHIYIIGIFRCDTVINHNTEFGLPTFPSKYDKPINCHYFLFYNHQRKNNTIRITFLYLDIDCSTDWIDIYDSYSSFNNPTKKICKSNKMVTYNSTTRFIKLIFNGNSGGKYRGFHASVTFTN